MLQLNIDFSLLNKFFGIPISRIRNYANKDFQEIMKLEAEQGNEKAQRYQTILSDPNKIKEIFKLANVQNKFKILQNMSEGDIDDLLPFLKQNQLALGLNFFTDEKLLGMCALLPPEEMAGMVFEKFSVFDVLKLMQESKIDQFIIQPEVERRYLENYMKTMDRTSMEKLMVKYFGEEFKGKEKREYMEHIQEMKDSEYDKFVLSLDSKMKMNFINGAIEQDESLLMLFEPDDMLRPMELLMKEDKIKMMSDLEPEFLIPMIKELPVDLTQIVLTQIDSKDFSEIIARDFKNILSSVVLFSSI